MKKLTSILYAAFFGLVVFFVAFGSAEAALIGSVSVPILTHFFAQKLTFPVLASGPVVTEEKTAFQKFLGEEGVDSIEGKSAEELAGLYNKFNTKQRAELEAKIEGKASKEDIQALKNSLLEVQSEQVKQLNEALKEQGLAIKKFAKPENGGKRLSFGEQVTKALEGQIDNLKKLKDGGITEAKGAGFEFEVKVPGTMTNTGNVSGGNVPVEDRLEGFDVQPSRRVRLLDVMSQRTTASNVVSWVYQANKDGDAGQTAEAADKNQIDFDIVVANEAVKKTTAFIKVSTEMLDDIEWIQSEIEQELMREVLKAVEQTVYDGDGTGQNHNGIRTVASAFAAGAFANDIDNANDIDVLTVAMNQIRIAQEMDAEPNFIFMNPTDITRLKMIKISTSDRRYVNRLFTIGSTLVLDGVPIIPTTLVTAGEYLIGDFNFSILVTRSNMRFDIGLDGDDFRKNLRTILGEWRGLTIVKNNRRSAFVAGVFATDKAALETA